MASYKTYTPGTFTESDRATQLKNQHDKWLNQELKQFTYDDFKVSDDTNSAFRSSI